MLSPGSIAGRMALILAVTLCAAQAVNFFIFAKQRREAVIAEMTRNPIEVFVAAAADPSYQYLTPQHELMRSLARGRPLRARARLLWLDDASLASEPVFVRNALLEKRLERALENRGVSAADVAAGYQEANRAFRERRLREMSDASRARRRQSPSFYEVKLSAYLEARGEWLNGRFYAPPPPPPVRASDFMLSAALFAVFVSMAIAIVALNMARPLRDLSAATKRVGDPGAKDALPVRGPGEVRKAITAFNEMDARVTNLLREKDVMLGALGHDLRTPLTSLRLRVEQMEPENLRKSAIETLDDAAMLLEDILELARSNNAAAKTLLFDVSSIAQDVVAGYRECGQDVSLHQEEGARITAPCKPASIERLMRNLIDNALKYAGAARVRLMQRDGVVRLTVEDDGPGVPEESIEAMLQPFERGEHSRNRATGGAGLGLAIAQAVAKAHGGELTLENLTPHGLRAQASFRAGA